MDSWYMVTLPSWECGVSGKAAALQEEFTQRFMLNGAPQNAAMFQGERHDLEICYFYFSPLATRIANTLILGYGAVPCPAPVQGEAALLVGEEITAKTLLRTADKSSG